MNYRKFKADRIFTGKEFLSGNFVLMATKDGEIIGWEEFNELDDTVEKHKGTLCPGFVNAHCHLELSHLKSIIPKHTGLIPFLLDVVSKRAFAQEEIQQKMEDAASEMFKEGIVAVGDIGNTANSIAVKSRSAIVWNNFVEVLGFRDENFHQFSQQYLNVWKQFRDKEIHLPDRKFITSLVPHAPYTVGTKTFSWINELTEGQTISCHNQESLQENRLYESGKSNFLKLLEKFGCEENPFPVTGKSSLQSWLPHFNNGQNLILVHNTFMDSADVDFALAHAKQYLSGLNFCLCVNANLYIENAMPPVEMLVSKGVQLVLGTDSLSSNDQLSIAAEIKTIRNKMPNIPLEMILQWATYNGARALGREKEIGSFEKGKKPGVILLSDDLAVNRLC